jgi:hypothetical protein
MGTLILIPAMSRVCRHWLGQAARVVWGESFGREASLGAAE